MDSYPRYSICQGDFKVEVEVLSKAGFVDIVIQFNNSPERNYPYRRKAGADSNGNKFVIISGCRITFELPCQT